MGLGGGVIDGQDAAVPVKGGQPEAEAGHGGLDSGIGHLLDVLDAGARRQRPPEVIDPVGGLNTDRSVAISLSAWDLSALAEA